MAFGLFGLPQANIIFGPGNQFVAEAKRILFGRVGIDMIAGPTDSLILADKTADPFIVATDLVSQAEHGYNSPVWLITDDRALAEDVLALVPELVDDLPGLNRDNAAAAWRDYAEDWVRAEREAMAATFDDYAPEHLTVMAQDLDWWLDRLTCYGSLFPGEENHGVVRRQGGGHQPCPAHLGCCALYWGPQRAQIHESCNLAAGHARRLTPGCRGHRKNFAP